MKLDGQIDVHIKFGEKTICERVHVNFNVPDALLLSENVCSKLAIVTYHPEVQAVPPATDQRRTGRVESDLSKLFAYLQIVQPWFKWNLRSQ